MYFSFEFFSHGFEINVQNLEEIEKILFDQTY